MKRDIKMQFLMLLAALSCVLVLPACGESQLPPEPEEGVLIYAALNPVDEKTEISVKKFNDAHEDVQIEIRDYSDEGGIERLRTELVLGRVPDIMEMHYYGKSGPKVAVGHKYYVVPGAYAESEDEYWMPYRQMAQKGYLEDLWPYIENDPELGRDGVLQPPLEAAEVNGGLYILFQKFCIFTLIGRESVVGDRYSWTLDELMEAFAAMPEGSTIMRYSMTKRDVSFNLLCPSLEQFVDRNTGECSFDSKTFRDLVLLLEGFPDEAVEEDPAAAEQEVRYRIEEGLQMLEGKMVDWQRDIGFSDAIWGERAAFPGTPTSDGSSGGYFYAPKTILSMSSTCRNKDAAWEYIRELVAPQRNSLEPITISMNIPVNRADYEWLIRGELKQQSDGLQLSPEIFEQPDIPIFEEQHFTFGRPIHLLTPLTAEDSQRHRDLIDHTNRLYWPNGELSDIVWEVLGTYFAGDLTLDLAVERIQNRVGLYLNEQR